MWQSFSQGVDSSEWEVRVYFLPTLPAPRWPVYFYISNRVIYAVIIKYTALSTRCNMDSRTWLLIITPQIESGVYVWQIDNPLYFKLVEHHQRPFGKPYDIVIIQIWFNKKFEEGVTDS